jgi:biopolymer transport protein ExbB/TolQ
VAFSAVILALIAASINYWIVSVRRGWLAEELAWLKARLDSNGAVK